MLIKEVQSDRCANFRILNPLVAGPKLKTIEKTPDDPWAGSSLPAAALQQLLHQCRQIPGVVGSHEVGSLQRQWEDQRIHRKLMHLSLPSFNLLKNASVFLRLPKSAAVG